MRQQATKVAFLVVSLALAAGIPFYAQDHSQHQAAPASPARGASTMTESQSIF